MKSKLPNTPAHRYASDQSPGLGFLARRELTAREHEVWSLIASGCSDAEIAQQLALNNLTVRFHMSNLFVKLGVSDRQQAVSRAAQRDPLSPAGEL